MPMTPGDWKRARLARNQPVQYTMVPHAPWRGIDDGEYVVCPVRGLTTLERREHSTHCGGCGRLIGEITGDQEYAEDTRRVAES
jgi:hypothetical protein